MAMTLETAETDDDAQMRLRREIDAQRPHKCACGHSQLAHDSGTAFCWLCDCNEWHAP